MSSPEDVKTEEPCSEVEETAVIKAEEPEVPEIEDHQDVKDVITASCSKISTREELEVMFADRYTEQCASFADIAKGFPASVVIHPWTSQAKRNYDYTNRGGGRGGGGGWRGGRGGGGGGGGGWRGGGGGYDRRRDGGGGYDRNRDGGGRGGGGYQGKRRWEDNNGHGGRGRDNPRVNYSGQH